MAASVITIYFIYNLHSYNTSSNGLYNRITRELYRALCGWIEGRSQGIGDTRIPTIPSDVDSAASPCHASSLTTMATGDEFSSQHGVGSGAGKAGVSLGMAVNSLNTLYGVLIALCEFGPNCLRMLVFPMLPNLTRRLGCMLDAGALDTPGVSTLSHADLRSMESLKTLMMVCCFCDWWHLGVLYGILSNMETIKLLYA